jgi:hypothetical protein
MEFDVVGDVAILIGCQWASYIATRGIFLGEWKGATWPNHGLPRGTPGFGYLVVIKFYGGRGVRPLDLPNHTSALTKV